jgi:hypothetical protein
MVLWMQNKKAKQESRGTRRYSSLAFLMETLGHTSRESRLCRIRYLYMLFY